MMAKRMGYRGSNPTALKAVSRVYRQEKQKRRQRERECGVPESDTGRRREDESALLPDVRHDGAGA